MSQQPTHCRKQQPVQPKCACHNERKPRGRVELVDRTADECRQSPTGQLGQTEQRERNADEYREATLRRRSRHQEKHKGNDRQAHFP